MKAAFFTLGCKVNQYETQGMTEILRNNGYEIVGNGESADIYIVNSCSVTAESDRKTRQAVRHFRRQQPSAIIVLTGCMPQAFPDSPAVLPEADIVMGNRSNLSLLNNIQLFLQCRERIVDLDSHKKGDVFTPLGISGFEAHTRAFVKIQDGCDRFCSYCIIPTARGRSRSKPIEDVKAEAERLAGNGFVELVFVGINLSAYGRDINTDICDAVETAAEIEGIKRVRLGSLEPDHISGAILERLSRVQKFCPQFHISLQSGSDTVLKRMNRHYTAGEYYELVQRIRGTFRNASITTDIIAGFPGESEGEFCETLEFAGKLRFEKAHIFPYSARPGTMAAGMPGQVEKHVKTERCARLASACGVVRAEYLAGQIGKMVSVLFETPEGDGISGYTMNYCPVLVKGGSIKAGSILDVEIVGVGDDCCVGVVK